MRPFQTIQTPDWTLQKIQDNVSAALDPITALPLSDGLLLESVTLTSGKDNLVSHKLGRKLRLWIVARKDANSTVWEKTSPAADKYLNLWCSTSCTVSLWVA